MTKRPIILSVVSDIHAGSSLGLSPPRFTLDDGGTYLTSKGQRWMWRNWKMYCAKVQATAEKHDAKVVTVFNGDICDGAHHRTTQLSTGNKALQVRLAFEATEPLVNLSEQVYVIRGTEAHVGPAAELEESYAGDLTNAITDGERKSWWQLTLTLRGTKFYFAHHGKLGQLDHTKLNPLGNMSYGVLHSFMEAKQKPPDIAFFSHNHRYADSYDNYPVRVISTPGWQLKTGYIFRIKPFAIPDIGGLIFTCWPGGQYERELMRWHPPLPQPVKVEL